MNRIILKNTTTDDIELGDIAIVVPGSGEVDVTLMLTAEELRKSDDLKTEYESGFIVVNDGSKDVSQLLRIYDFVPRFTDVSSIPFTTLGLIKATPEFDKGRKVSASYYTDEAQTEIVVKKTFVDRLDVNNHLLGLDITFEWYNTEDAVDLTKLEFKPLSTYESGQLVKKRRDRAIDYLVEGAKGTPAEPLVNALFVHYATEANLFIEIGSQDLENAVNNETDPTILGYLNTIVLPPSGTIKDSILAQIT